MQYILSNEQIKLGCALPDDYLPLREIKQRVYGGPPSRSHWKELVNLEIAEFAGEGNPVHLRRGLRWAEFFERYGYSDTFAGCEYIEIEESIFELFRLNNVIALHGSQAI